MSDLLLPDGSPNWAETDGILTLALPGPARRVFTVWPGHNNIGPILVLQRTHGPVGDDTIRYQGHMMEDINAQVVHVLKREGLLTGKIFVEFTREELLALEDFAGSGLDSLREAIETFGPTDTSQQRLNDGAAVLALLDKALNRNTP